MTYSERLRLALLEQLNGRTGLPLAQAMNTASSAYQAVLTASDDLLQLMLAVAAFKLALEDLQDQVKGRIEQCKAALLTAMEESGAPSLTLPNHTVSLAANPRFVEIVDVQKLPSHYYRHREPIPDLDKIARALDDGAEDGLQDAARLVVPNSQHLVFKARRKLT